MVLKDPGPYADRELKKDEDYSTDKLIIYGTLMSVHEPSSVQQLHHSLVRDHHRAVTKTGYLPVCGYLSDECS